MAEEEAPAEVEAAGRETKDEGEDVEMNEISGEIPITSKARRRKGTHYMELFYAPVTMV